MSQDQALTTNLSQIDYLLLDGSSSMMGELWHRSCAAIDAYIEGLRQEHVDSIVKLQVFDSQDHELMWRDCHLNDFVLLRDDPIGAWWHSTPLYDAMSIMAWRLRDLDPHRCSVVILTDGEENSSKFTDQEQARSLIKWMEARGWQVTFIGIDFANHKLAEKLGAKPSQAIGVQKTLLEDSTKALAKKRGLYGRTGQPMHWTEDEQTQFGGYLAGKKPN